MSVSREEYEAALARVQRSGQPCVPCHPSDGDCICRRHTLAALGLDEEPLNPPKAWNAPAPYRTYIGQGANGHVHIDADGDLPPGLADEAADRIREHAAWARRQA